MFKTLTISFFFLKLVLTANHVGFSVNSVEVKV